MSILFENTWKTKDGYYERVFDTDTQTSHKRKISSDYEFYVPQSRGSFSYILDDSVKLAQQLGTYKDASGNFGVTDPMYKNIRDNYWNKSLYNTEPGVFYLDIETRVGVNSIGFPVPDKALEEIVLMQFYDSKTKEMYVLASRDWKHQAKYAPKLNYKVNYINCGNEYELLQAYLKLFKKLDPLVVYAWNGLGFDYPYIYNRIKRVGLNTNKLSNYGKVSVQEYEMKGQTNYKFSSDGHFYIDMIDVYLNFRKVPRENMKLDTIAFAELKKNKVSHDEYLKFDDFYTGKYLRPENPTQKQMNSEIYKASLRGDADAVKELAYSEFVYYGCEDTYIIKELDDALDFTNIMIMISEKMGVTFSDTLGTVKPWSQYISNVSQTNKQVLPPRRDHKDPDIVGGYVRDTIPGLYHWILSEDVNSMYPLLGMVGSNMSPETYIPMSELSPELRSIVLKYFNSQDEEARFKITPQEWKAINVILKRDNVAIAINGAVFSKDKLGMIPELVLDIYYSRKASKSSMKDYEKRTIMIEDIINSRKVA